MIPQAFRADLFKEQMRESLRRETVNSRTVRIARHVDVYVCRDQDEEVYFIESGRSNCSCSPLKVKNACSPSTVRKIFSVSYACPS